MPSAKELQNGLSQPIGSTPAEIPVPSTEDLVKAVLAGEKSAFAQLVRLYERAAIITAHSVLHDFERAQDAAQEAFVIAYTRLNQLQAAAAFGPWLLKIVLRRAYSIHRARREEQLETDVAAANTDPTGDWFHRQQEVIAHIARLPKHERLVIVMRYLDGHSLQEISSTTGKPVTTIKKQLSRGLARLRKWLKDVPS